MSTADVVCSDADVLVSGRLGAYITKAPHNGLFRTTGLLLLLPTLTRIDSRADRCAALHRANYNMAAQTILGVEAVHRGGQAQAYTDVLLQTCAHMPCNSRTQG